MAKNDQVASIPDDKVDPFNGKPEIEKMDFAELMALLDAGEAVHLNELDDTSVVEKAALVGQPFMITSWVVKSSAIGQYVVVHGVTPDDSRIVFADGSTGIRDQLILFGVDKPILCPKGLRASTYIVELETGPTQATTYYLDTAR